MRKQRNWALIAILSGALFGTPFLVAKADWGGGGGGVSQTYVDTQVATIMAAMPQPLATIPLGPQAAGISGSGLTYVPGNAQQRQAVQRTVTNTDASGNFSVTWVTSFISSTPTVVVEAGNPSGTNAIQCNWQTRSSTNVTGKCWQVNTSLIALLGITITIAPSIPTTNTPISVIMAEPTQ